MAAAQPRLRPAAGGRRLGLGSGYAWFAWPALRPGRSPYLPQSAYELPPVTGCDDPVGRREEMLLSAMPRHRRQPYRIRGSLEAVFDANSVMEAQRYGGSVVTALARLNGHPVGVVAGDPYVAGDA